MDHYKHMWNLHGMPVAKNTFDEYADRLLKEARMLTRDLYFCTADLHYSLHHTQIAKEPNKN